MKLVWSPEIASSSYIDTVNSVSNPNNDPCKLLPRESSESEFISAMAGGWNAKLIVEVWTTSTDGCTDVTTSVGLAIAAGHAGARHVCIVESERSRVEYVNAMRGRGVSSMPEMVVGEAEEVLGLEGVDFLVVDARRNDFCRVLRLANLSQLGAVLVCKNATQRSTTEEFPWGGVLGSDRRVVRTVVIPVGMGLHIAYVAAAAKISDHTKSKKGPSRWISHIDQQSGEEHVFRG